MSPKDFSQKHNFANNTIVAPQFSYSDIIVTQKEKQNGIHSYLQRKNCFIGNTSYTHC